MGYGEVMEKEKKSIKERGERGRRKRKVSSQK